MLDLSLHEKAIMGQSKKANKMKVVNVPYEVEVFGKKIIVFPHVFYPAIDTELLIQSIQIKPNERVLEPFAGTGAISIFLFPNASTIVSTDINPFAVKNMQENIRLHGLEKKVKAIHTDIFPNGEEKFDVIVANPPYSAHEAKNVEEKSMWDKDHETVKRFLEEAKNYLKPNGRIYCSWANFADFEFFEDLAKANQYSIKSINEIKNDWQIFRVYEIKRI